MTSCVCTFRVTTSNMDEEEKAIIKELVKQLGGCYTAKMRRTNTHLIVDRALGQKWENAEAYGVLAVRTEWLIDTAVAGKPSPAVLGVMPVRASWHRPATLAAASHLRCSVAGLPDSKHSSQGSLQNEMGIVQGGCCQSSSMCQMPPWQGSRPMRPSPSSRLSRRGSRSMLQPTPPPGRISGRATRRTTLWKPSWLKVQECHSFDGVGYTTLTNSATSVSFLKPTTL